MNAPVVNTNTITTSLSVENLQDMIKVCSVTEEGESLKDAMQHLKIALLENPSACALLLDEDIGLCTATLRRMTGQQIRDEAEKAAASKRRTTEKIDISSPEALKRIEENLFDGI